mmetsp:Transcript_23660/g.67932  ORF Transcript_23660/g.67932 Transcript_23660/m.67932 type:complete len:324 (+) Transcript_23660:2425-3396(+)
MPLVADRLFEAEGREVQHQDDEQPKHHHPAGHGQRAEPLSFEVNLGDYTDVAMALAGGCVGPLRVLAGGVLCAAAIGALRGLRLRPVHNDLATRPASGSLGGRQGDVRYGPGQIDRGRMVPRALVAQGVADAADEKIALPRRRQQDEARLPCELQPIAMAATVHHLAEVLAVAQLLCSQVRFSSNIDALRRHHLPRPNGAAALQSTGAILRAAVVAIQRRRRHLRRVRRRGRRVHQHWRFLGLRRPALADGLRYQVGDVGGSCLVDLRLLARVAHVLHPQLHYRRPRQRLQAIVGLTRVLSHSLTRQGLLQSRLELFGRSRHA